MFEAIRRNDAARQARITDAELRLLDASGRSALFMAILHGRTALVRRWIARGAAVDPRTRGHSALSVARKKRRASVVRFLRSLEA